MFFRRSIDNHTEYLQLLLEELVAEQLSVHNEPQNVGKGTWMGFPWCLQLLQQRLKLEGLRAKNETLASIINAATGLARDLQARRSAELHAARLSPRLLDPNDIERSFSLQLFLRAASRSGMSPKTPPEIRARMIRCVDECGHQLDLLACVQPSQFATTEAAFKDWFERLHEEARQTQTAKAMEYLLAISHRPPSSCFHPDGS